MHCFTMLLQDACTSMPVVRLRGPTYETLAVVVILCVAKGDAALADTQTLLVTCTLAAILCRSTILCCAMHA
jgi:hypothetical protein